MKRGAQFKMEGTLSQGCGEPLELVATVGQWPRRRQTPQSCNQKAGFCQRPDWLILLHTSRWEPRLVKTLALAGRPSVEDLGLGFRPTERWTNRRGCFMLLPMWLCGDRKCRHCSCTWFSSWYGVRAQHVSRNSDCSFNDFTYLLREDIYDRKGYLSRILLMKKESKNSKKSISTSLSEDSNPCFLGSSDSKWSSSKAP